MWKKPRKLSTLFYKYLLSYLLIFLIPFTIISLSFYFVATNNLHSAIVNSNMLKLEQAKDFFDERLSELRNLAIRISLDNQLTPYKLSQPYSGREGISELKNYAASNSLIDSFVLTFHQDPVLYSTKGTTSAENLVKNMYPALNEEETLFLDELATITEPTLRTIQLKSLDGSLGKVIVYICPIPPQSPYTNGAVLFFIKENKLSELISRVLGDFEGSTYIYNQQANALITAMGTLDDEFLPFIDSPSGVYPGVNTLKIKGEDHAFLKVDSKNNGLIFAATMPTAQFYQQIVSLKTTILFMLVGTGILGLSITILQTKRHFKPIDSLIRTIRLGLGESELPTHENLEQVRESIEVVFEDSEKLRQRVLSQSTYVRDQFLLRLLKGNISADRVEELSSDLQIEKKGDHYFVVLIAFNGQISEQALAMLEKVVYKHCIAYGVELFNENALALLVNMEQNSDSLRQEFVRGLANGLSNRFNIEPSIGVGKIYGSAKQINLSFVEASAAVEYHLLSADRTVFFFENVTEAGDVPDWFSFEHEMQLTQGIKQGNLLVAKEALASIMQELKDKNTSVNLLRCMCFDLINAVLKVNSDLEMVFDAELISDISEFNSLEDLEERLARLITEIIAKVEVAKEVRGEQINHGIIEYVAKNFKDHDLSLTKIADEFSLSTSYLSRLIKKKTGLTFTQYVWELRVAEFKHKLITTEEPIKNIVRKIGYVDVANFTRKFRKSEGMTPGQYRKQKKELKGEVHSEA